jgi:hypothetical protein
MVKCTAAVTSVTKEVVVVKHTPPAAAAARLVVADTCTEMNLSTAREAEAMK